MTAMVTANLILRFLLEIFALVGFGTLAWAATNGGWQYICVVAVVSFVMVIWGVFAVPDDPSRSGAAPYPISGLRRLVLELTILFGGAVAFWLAGYGIFGLFLSVLVAAHYAFSGARISWLLRQ